MKRHSDCKCEKLIKRKVSDTIPLAGQLVKVTDAPALVCQDCGEVNFDGKYISDLEAKLLRRKKQAA